MGMSLAKGFLRAAGAALVLCLLLSLAEARPAERTRFALAPGRASQPMAAPAPEWRPDLFGGDPAGPAATSPAFVLAPALWQSREHPAEENGEKTRGEPGQNKDEAGKPRSRTGRAWIELGSFMAVSQTRYWIQWGRFIEDWQFKLSFRDQTHRLFGLAGLRFDSNNFTLNWTHAAAGAIYYEFARTNNLGWRRSLLMSCLGSAWWEVVTEFKEVISISDLVFTGIGGYAIGEPWYQTTHFLSHQPGFLPRLLSFANPQLKINDWFDRHDPDSKAYSQPAWHDFSLFAGARRMASTGLASETGAYFGLRTEIISLPGYGQPGELREGFSDTARTEIVVDYAVRNGHADETNLRARVMGWGLVRQSIGEDLEGHSFTFGLGTGFSYFKKRPLWEFDYDPVPVKQGYDLRLDEPRRFTDKIAVVNVAGPVVDWALFRRDLRLRTVIEAYFDFGLVNGYALNAYSATHDISGMKTTVLYYGYYYGFGTTLSADASLEWKAFRLRGAASFHAYGSFDGLDRYADEITNNAHLSDTRFRGLVEAAWRLPGLPLDVFLRYEGVRRRGRLAEVRVAGIENRTFAGLEFHF